MHINGIFMYLFVLKTVTGYWYYPGLIIVTIDALMSGESYEFLRVKFEFIISEKLSLNITVHNRESKKIFVNKMDFISIKIKQLNFKEPF